MSDRREHAPGPPSEEGMSRLQRTASRVQKHVARRLVIESNRDLSKTVLLAGTGRSGTTWVSNILLAGGGGRYLFEPFHSRRVSACSGFRYRQYLSPDAEEPELGLVADQILRGAIRDPWIDQLNRTVLAKWRLAKDIRANLMLGWLARLFPAVRVVVVVRHPAPVALSKLALDWGTPVDELVQQDALMRDHLEGAWRRLFLYAASLQGASDVLRGTLQVARGVHRRDAETCRTIHKTSGPVCVAAPVGVVS